MEGGQEEINQEGAVESLRSQAESVELSLKAIAEVQGDLSQIVVEVGTGELENLNSRLASCVAGLESHTSYLRSGVSKIDGTMATLAHQKNLADVVGSISGFFSKNNLTEPDMAKLISGAKLWIGDSYQTYFEVSEAEGRMDVLLSVLNDRLDEQKGSLEGILSDIEAGTREGAEASELRSILSLVDRNVTSASELSTTMAEMSSEVECEYSKAIESAVTGSGSYKTSSLAKFNAAAQAAVKSTSATFDELIVRVEECETAIGEIRAALGELKADVDELLSMIQSITFMPEYATEKAVALYTLKTDSYVTDMAKPYCGKCERTPEGTIELNYIVRPASAAKALDLAYDADKNAVGVFGYYAKAMQLKSVSSTDYIDFEVSDVMLTNESRGVITVYVNHTLKEEFYFREIGAKCALEVSYGKTDFITKFVDLVPNDKSSTIYVEGLTLSANDVTFDDGENYTLTAYLSPSNATFKNVYWSSDNEGVVTVENGVLTAVEPGKARITAKAQGVDEWGLPVYAYCDVTVQEAIKLTGPSYVEVGKTATMTLDHPASLVIDSKTWWIDNGKWGAAAEMDENGYGFVSGTGYYYDKENNEYESITVKCQINETVVSHSMKVVAPQPAGVNIPAIGDSDNVVVKLGSTLDLKGTVKPDAVAESGLFRVQYLANAQGLDIAEINFYTGMVTYKKPGTTYMYVDVYSQDGYYYFAPGNNVYRRTVTVNVEPYWVNTMTLPDTYELNPGQSVTIAPEFTSDEENVQPTYKDVIWTSENPEIASVDENTGKITAHKEGTVTIVATTANEWSVPSGVSQKSASCLVTVTTPVDPYGVGYFYYSDGTWSETIQSGKTVIGIIFSTESAAASDAHLRDDGYSGCSHGLVLSIKEYTGKLGYISTSTMGTGTGTWLYNNGYHDFVTDTTKPTGYASTKALNIYNAYAYGEYGYDDYALLFRSETGVVDQHTSSVASPSSASPWYIPSYYEMSLMYQNLDKINAALSEVLGASKITSAKYWSSTLAARANSNEVYVFSYNMGNGGWYETASASDNNSVRVILAF